MNGIGKTITNEILNDQRNVRTIFEASKTDINIENLCHARTMVNNRKALIDLPSFINYIQYVVNLINAPDSQDVDAGCLNDLLGFEEGALALNFARSEKLDPNTLAKSLHLAINNSNNLAHSKESKAAYINLMTEVVSQYRPSGIASAGYQLLEAMSPKNQPNRVDFIKELFNDLAISILLNRARVIGLNANVIVVILKNREVNESLLLLDFVLDIIGANIQKVNGQLMNIIISTDSKEATNILNQAHNANLNASSVARLMSCSNTYNDVIANLKVVIDLIQPQKQAAIRLEADAVNRYLALDGSPERIDADRTQKIGRERIIATINQALEAQDAAIQGQVTMIQMLPAHLRAQFIAQLPEEMRNALIARLPENIRNPILAALNPQNAA